MADDDSTPDTQIIKQSIYLRAKYKSKRQPARQILSCTNVVPHPQNRGGYIITSERARSLVAELFPLGYDPTEAQQESVCVCVEVEFVGDKYRDWFTAHFLENAGRDPDHFVQHGTIIKYGGLSHNTVNLCGRNMYGGMFGVCMYTDRRVT